MKAVLTRVSRSSMLMNGFSLAMSSAITSALGLLYWVIAARLYTVQQVGLNGTLISTIATIATAAQLNLGSVLTRFLPTVGRSAARWILTAYAITAVTSVLFCLIFFLGAHAWTPSLRFLTADWSAAGWFTLAAIPWAIFGLNDWVLAGLRKAVWVPAGTTIFAVMKIILLVALAETTLRPFGPFASWAISSLIEVLMVVALIFFGLLPRIPRAATVPVDSRLVARFLSGDFLGTLFFLLTMGLIPIIVMERIGAEGAAEYYVAWTVSYPLYLVSMAIGTALLAEGAANRQNLTQLAWRALVHTMPLVALGAAVLASAAPWVLQLFGSAYVHDEMALRLLALSAVPYAFVSVYLSVARVRGHMVTVVAVQALMQALVLGCGIPLLGWLGVLGMGIAWLGAQTVLALGLAAIWVAKGVRGHRIVEV